MLFEKLVISLLVEALIFSITGAARGKTMSVRHNEIVVVGSTVIDFVAYCNTLPVRGQTVFGLSFAKNYGGKGSNQAVQCARLRLGVTHVGKVGQDSFGDDYLEQLAREGVDTGLISVSADKSTGIANINVESSTGANTIVVVSGANHDLFIGDSVPIATQITSANVLICQNEIPRETTLEALKLAKSGRGISIFNPAPAGKDLAELVASSDIVCPNETELATLTDIPTTTDAEIEAAGNKLLAMGCKVVVATLGEKGAYVAISGKGVFMRAATVTAVDSTGAGDSFIGTLASNLARGVAMRRAVENALHCATISVTRPGAQVSFARLEEIPIEFRPPEGPIHITLFDKNKILDSL